MSPAEVEQFGKQVVYVERLPDASHWVHHDEHERVTQLLTDFFAPTLPAGN